MVDITKCEGIDCPIKKDCYRYTSQPGEYRQSYYVISPYEDGKCDCYWKLGKKRGKNESKGST